jgi:hypothetical protein
MLLKLLINLISKRRLHYTRQRGTSEPGDEKGEILPRGEEYGATFFDPCPCDEITTATVKAWKCPDNAFYDRHLTGAGCYTTEPRQ